MCKVSNVNVKLESSLEGNGPILRGCTARGKHTDQKALTTCKKTRDILFRVNNYLIAKQIQYI